MTQLGEFGVLGAERGQVAGTGRGYRGKKVGGMVGSGDRVEEVVGRRGDRRGVRGREWWAENG